ncbi:MAG: hypothetical protein CL916_13945 [Deltaproteobacteria bacterium]|nr:hypothetical protein [Deltaproteobacteria bacterium]
MSDFIALQKKWNRKKEDMGLERLLTEKFYRLLIDENEEGVLSCLHLLISFGDEGICEVLEDEYGQIRVRNDLGIVHRALWIQQLLSFVESTSNWSVLVQRGCFERMKQEMYQIVGELEWKSVSARLHPTILKESQKMLEIPSGSFIMGALTHDESTEDNEYPRHEVIFTKSILMSVYPCTQGLYESVMGNNPSSFTGTLKPVEQVSWCSAILFCNRLSTREGLEPPYEIPTELDQALHQPMMTNRSNIIRKLSNKVRWKKTANGYRLPTEAEWEYCARGGDSPLYAGSNDVDEVAWYRNNSTSQTHLVGQKDSNGYGIYDMSGNVWEWVWDSWRDNYGTSSSSIDPTYIHESNSLRVIRGGCWSNSAHHTRVSSRTWGVASNQRSFQGFRFSRTL